jgi:hypothetical protein
MIHGLHCNLASSYNSSRALTIQETQEEIIKENILFIQVSRK